MVNTVPWSCPRMVACKPIWEETRICWSRRSNFRWMNKNTFSNLNSPDTLQRSHLRYINPHHLISLFNWLILDNKQRKCRRSLFVNPVKTHLRKKKIPKHVSITGRIWVSTSTKVYRDRRIAYTDMTTIIVGIARQLLNQRTSMKPSVCRLYLNLNRIIKTWGLEMKYS